MFVRRNRTFKRRYIRYTFTFQRFKISRYLWGCDTVVYVYRFAFLWASGALIFDHFTLTAQLKIMLRRRTVIRCMIRQFRCVSSNAYHTDSIVTIGSTPDHNSAEYKARINVIHLHALISSIRNSTHERAQTHIQPTCKTCWVKDCDAL